MRRHALKQADSGARGVAPPTTPSPAATTVTSAGRAEPAVCTLHANGSLHEVCCGIRGNAVPRSRNPRAIDQVGIPGGLRAGGHPLDLLVGDPLTRFVASSAVRISRSVVGPLDFHRRLRDLLGAFDVGDVTGARAAVALLRDLILGGEQRGAIARVRSTPAGRRRAGPAGEPSQHNQAHHQKANHTASHSPPPRLQKLTPKKLQRHEAESMPTPRCLPMTAPACLGAAHSSKSYTRRCKLPTTQTADHVGVTLGNLGAVGHRINGSQPFGLGAEIVAVAGCTQTSDRSGYGFGGHWRIPLRVGQFDRTRTESTVRLMSAQSPPAAASATSPRAPTTAYFRAFLACCFSMTNSPNVTPRSIPLPVPENARETVPLVTTGAADDPPAPACASAEA